MTRLNSSQRFLAIGGINGQIGQNRKKDPWTILVKLSDDNGNVDFEDEEVEVAIVDRKGNPVVVTETERTANLIKFTSKCLSSLLLT